MEYVTLSNGVKMPIMGYGVYQVTKDECERCVLDALKAGYRSLDTAQSYFNEEEVGNAIQKSELQREEIFLTTKVWVEHYGYDACRKSVEESLKKLKTDYLGSKNPRLHMDETMIALSISAATNPEARLALEQFPKLKGCQAHTSVMLSSVDVLSFRKLGVELTCEPKFEQGKKL